MFKKLFNTLTKSSEDRYLDSLEQQAASLAQTGANQSATVLRSLATLKHQIDHKIKTRDPSVLQIDGFEDLAQSVCEGIQSKIAELATLERKLPGIVTDRDGRKFQAYVDEWRVCLATITKGYATLHYAATGESANDLGALSGAQVINPAMETLELQIRTAERIRNELG